MSKSPITSEKILMDGLHALSEAGAAVIQVRSREPIRSAMAIRKSLVIEGRPYKEWDAINGFRVFTNENWQDHTHSTPGSDQTQDFFTALKFPLDELRRPGSIIHAQDDKVHYFVYVDPHPWIANNPMAASLIHQYAAMLPAYNACIIFVTPEVSIPDIAQGVLLITDMPTPTPDEFKRVAHELIDNAVSDKASFPDGHEIEEDGIERIVGLGAGLTMFEFETHASIGIIQAMLSKSTALTTDHILEGLSVGKTEVVKQSEILSLVKPVEMETVAGMQALKEWLAQRAGCFSDEAIEYGIDTPKGMVLVGVPGTGKSLVAKVTASALGIPLVRMDLSAVFSKYVGDSESRIRSALKMVEAMSPCVLFVDEIDKGLGGAGGSSGDGGISSRVLGTYLSWLQDCAVPVFNVVTANRVGGLPPELLRQGRFDKIWSLGLPNAADRREALAVHLTKRGRTIEDYDANELADFDAKSEGYVPAEIEAAVKDAIIRAYHDDASDLKIGYLLAAIENMIPQSKSHKQQIDAIVEWASTNATPVDRMEAAPAVDNTQLARRRRVGRR